MNFPPVQRNWDIYSKNIPLKQPLQPFAAGLSPPSPPEYYTVEPEPSDTGSIFGYLVLNILPS